MVLKAGGLGKNKTKQIKKKAHEKIAINTRGC